MKVSIKAPGPEVPGQVPDDIETVAFDKGSRATLIDGRRDSQMSTGLQSRPPDAASRLSIPNNPEVCAERSSGGRKGFRSMKSGVLLPAHVPRNKLKRFMSQSTACCRRIVDNNLVVTLTTLLTLWVLICDDVRIVATEKPQDEVFEMVLIVCLIVFGLEIVFTSIGKEDYFMGFFFVLDVVSTASLALDLPSVQESLAEDEGGVSGAQEGKTARIGAKAARVVRIVRLVRIVKLYKIIVTHFEKRIDQCMGIKPGHDEDAEFCREDDEDELEHTKKKESRVGKQLSHATLKRVIVLILAMLVVVPSLSASESLKYPLSPSYGADEVGETFLAKQNNLVPVLFYEQSLLRYIYYHNWFAGNGNCPAGKQSTSCPNAYYNHLFWVGVSGRNKTAVTLQLRDALLRHTTVEQFEQNVSRSNDLYNFGEMPAVARDAIGSQWDIDCSRTRADGVKEYSYGFSLLDNTDAQVSYKVRCAHGDLRATEYDRYFPRLIDAVTAKQSHFVFYFDQRVFFKEMAAYGLAVTVYVCLSLVVAIMMFSRDANRLVLHPVESMIAKVERIREDPLAAVKMGDQEFKLEEITRIRQHRSLARVGAGSLGLILGRIKAFANCGAGSTIYKQPMETLILEKTLVKLGSLLALGFGEAGANIINKNMQAGDSADVNVMIKGELVQCIYGQARIQDFSVITEVLQSKVMQFVNQIAEIVHGVVVEYLGAANKNTGDTFLLVWRSTKFDASDLPKLADMSVAAFCKIIASLQQANNLTSYRAHPRIQFLLGSRYRVALHIGLHAGWAFEGAMGSEYKIDASYISPNIAITANVEQATQHFRVPLLVTEHVVQKCSPGVAEVCRKIDTVYIAGNKDAMDLHCVDLDPQSLCVDGPRKALSWNPRERYKVRQFMEAEKNKNWVDDSFASQCLHSNASIQEMRERFTVEFLQIFKMGFKNYIEGEWSVARGFFLRACRILGCPDGPCESLLAFMSKTNFEAPADWRGYRDLGPLLQGPPKNSSRHSQELPVTVATNETDSYDRVAIPSEGGTPDHASTWQLPNAIPQENHKQISAGGQLRATANCKPSTAKELHDDQSA